MVDTRTRELQDEVAERTRAQQALVEAREAALEGSRLKSEFLANMSHEIRTPMNGIIGMTALALDHRLPPEAREYLEIVQSSADGLLHVINDVLNFAKIEAGRLDLVSVDFDVRELIDDVVALLGPQAAKKTLTLRSRVSPEVPPRLVGDPQRLRPDPHQSHWQRAEVHRRGGSAHRGWPRRLARAVVVGGRAALRGRGYRDRDRRERSRAHLRRVHAGRRLGDAAVQRDRARAGHFVAAGAPDGRRSGGRERIRAGQHVLVRARVRHRRSGIAPAGQIPVKRTDSPLTVLLAEDGPVNQLLVKRLLENAGHTVTVVDTGTQAVEAVARTHYDIVLMDIQMPGMDGIEATVSIRKREGNAGRRVPVIALTAHAMEGDRERCLAAGMDGYLSKPIRPEALFASLAEHAGTSVSP